MPETAESLADQLILDVRAADTSAIDTTATSLRPLLSTDLQAELDLLTARAPDLDTVPAEDVDGVICQLDIYSVSIRCAL